MQPSTQEARPPYVTFTTRTEEDREASIEQGRAVVKDVHFALITPHGSKDRVERKVSEWFTVLDEAVAQERMPATWVQAYKSAYQLWKEGKEVPLEGTSIRNWPLLTPAQVENLTSIKILTVEDLAAANEELMGRIGMGGRVLKDKAQAWLMTAGSPGAKSAERMAQLEAANRQLAETNAQLAEANEMLKRDLKRATEAETA